MARCRALHLSNACLLLRKRQQNMHTATTACVTAKQDTHNFSASRRLLPFILCPLRGNTGNTAEPAFEQQRGRTDSAAAPTVGQVYERRRSWHASSSRGDVR